MLFIKKWIKKKINNYMNFKNKYFSNKRILKYLISYINKNINNI